MIEDEEVKDVFIEICEEVLDDLGKLFDYICVF